MLEETLGVEDLSALPLEKFSAAIDAQKDAVAGATVEIWISAADGLVVASTTDLDPASALAAAASALPALDEGALPSDVPPDFAAWFFSSAAAPSAVRGELPGFVRSLSQSCTALSPLADYLDEAVPACSEARNVCAWAAPDAGGLFFCSSSASGLDAGRGARLAANARALADKVFGGVEGASVEGTGGASAWKASFPLDSAMESAVVALAGVFGEEPEDGDRAELRDAAGFVSRVFGATNEVGMAFEDGVLRVRHHAAGGVAAGGRRPDASAALALAGRAPADMRPVAVGEFFAARTLRGLLSRFPESFADTPELPGALFEGVSADVPVRTLSLAGANKVSSVVSIPLADIHVLANFSRIGAAKLAEARASAIEAFAVDGTLLDEEEEEDDEDGDFDLAGDEEASGNPDQAGKDE